MAKSDSSCTPSLSDLMQRLYDVQARLQCAAASLNENEDCSAIRVLRHADAVTLEVINHLDAMDLHSPEVLRIAEQVKNGSTIVQ